MKKIVAFLLATIMAFSCVACGGGNNDNTQPPSEPESNVNTESSQVPNSSEVQSESEVELHITDANEILTKAWAKYEEEEKFVAVGGHYSDYNDGAPAKYDISQVADIEAVFCIPAEVVAMIDDMASLQHGLNVNNFSAMACHLKEGADMQTVVEGIKNMTMNNQWVYGNPDRLIMFTIGDEYLVTAFGNGEIIDAFQSKVLPLYDHVPELVVDEDL